MAKEEMRAGDQERADVVEHLEAALSEGRLDLQEYDDRVRNAYAAKTYRELDVLVSDLPQPATPPQPARASRGGAHPGWAIWVEIAVAVLAVAVVANASQLIWPVLFWLSWFVLPPAAAAVVIARHTRTRKQAS
jgi:hypothetical protein